MVGVQGVEGEYMTIDLLTPEDLSKLVHLHVRTVVRLAQEGTIPALKFGGRWRFRREDIEGYIQSQLRRRQRKILVVDDDVEIRKMLKRVIEGMGHQAILAESGKEALQLLRNEDGISLLILDLLMAGVTGLDILKHLKKKNMNIPVMIFTGHIDHEIFEKALGYQFITVISKPSSLEIIQGAIGLLLDGVEVFEEESA
jgi:excisionase family DNA binding protein